MRIYVYMYIRTSSCTFKIHNPAERTQTSFKGHRLWVWPPARYITEHMWLPTLALLLQIYGVPTVRHDIRAPRKQSIANAQNYGNEPDSMQLIHPAASAERGVNELHYAQQLSQNSVRCHHCPPACQGSHPCLGTLCKCISAFFAAFPSMHAHVANHMYRDCCTFSGLG